MSLYDPYGGSEDGVIEIHPKAGPNLSMTVVVKEWSNSKNGVTLLQGSDDVSLDAEQVEALYEILKHNR